jgi:adenosylcobinamide-phosphate synthase
MLSSIILLLAFLLDLLLGELRKFHPLVGFGFFASTLEKKYNIEKHQNKSSLLTTSLMVRLLGVFCWLVLVLPLPVIYFLLHQSNWLFYCLDIVIVYFAIGNKSLQLHANQILVPLMEKDIDKARHYCSYIVSRNTETLNEQEIARATTESVLENGHDAVIASLVWFIIGGVPLVLVHRLANTLDAMWGYKTPRFVDFGWFSARIDDLLGWPSAKVTSFLYALQGRFFSALRNGFMQGRQYKSLNGGWVMATGATVLNIKLGGVANYNGQHLKSVELGCGKSVSRFSIVAGLQLVKNAALIFIGCSFLVNLIFVGYIE